MLSPPFKVAADLQATAEQTGFWVSTRGLADPVGTRRLNWIYRAFTAIVTIGCWEPVAWTLWNSGFARLGVSVLRHAGVAAGLKLPWI